MRRKIFLLAALLSLLVSGMASAATSYETEVINNVGIGDISISLKEFELDEDGNEIPYENDKVVLPGQKVDKIVRITNEANTAWIRAKLEYTSDDGIRGLSDQMVTLDSDEWIKAGDYFYYPVPVEKDSSIDFVKEVRIPTEWDESYADKSFSIIVTADAVQTDNFTPDFTSEDPWFGTVIETCVHTVYSPVQAGKTAFSVAFEGGAEGLVRTGDDFFSNWGELMPGDTVSDTVQIKNSYSRPVTIYFWTETIADDMLLKALQLEIKNGDNVIYSGTMDGAITDKVTLAYLKSGEETRLTYTLSVPAELNNQYALSSTKTKWIFSAQLKSSSGGGSGGSASGGYSDSGDNSGGPGVTDNQTDNSQNDLPGPVEDVIKQITDVIRIIPKMGDTNVGLYAFIVMVLSGAGAMVLWKKGKRKGKEERHE